MKEYILVTRSKCGNDITAISITANDKNMALSKAYWYFGTDSRLELDEFNILCEHAPFERIKRVLYDFTGETILYFAEKHEDCLANELCKIGAE